LFEAEQMRMKESKAKGVRMIVVAVSVAVYTLIAWRWI
jgi:hypothetical protein